MWVLGLDGEPALEMGPGGTLNRDAEPIREDSALEGRA